MRSDHPVGTRTFAFTILALGLAFAAGLPAFAAQAPAAVPNPVLAEIEGKSITQSDVEKAGSAELQQLEREYAKSRRTLVENKLKQMVLDVMIEAEAKAKGVSQEQLV